MRAKFRKVTKNRNIDKPDGWGMWRKFIVLLRELHVYECV